MHYWRMLKASKFNVAFRCRLALPRGLKPHSEELLCHIKGQAVSVRLCGGCGAPEMVGERPPTPPYPQLQNPAVSQEL